jgi:copper chaperone
MSNERETVLFVEGMTCHSCVRHVTAALKDVDGVEKVEVKLREGTALVRFDSAAATIDQLIEAVREAGYESQATTV